MGPYGEGGHHSLLNRIVELIPVALLAMNDTVMEAGTWWRKAAIWKRRLAVLAGIVGSTTVLAMALIGGLELFGEFTTNEDRLAAVERHVRDSLAPVARVRVLEARVSELGEVMGEMQVADRTIMQVLAELRCRARVEDAVLPNRTACWNSGTDRELERFLRNGREP